MTGYLNIHDDDQLLHRIARQLVRDQSNGLCADRYPNPCPACDCFEAGSIPYAQQQAGSLLAFLRGLSVEPTEEWRQPAMIADMRKAMRAHLADLVVAAEQRLGLHRP